MAKRQFPRAGAWVVLVASGALAIINTIGRESVVDVEEEINGVPTKVPKTMLDASAPFAELHTVETGEGEANGETLKVLKNTPFSDFRQATFDEMRQVARTSHVAPHRARANGYTLTSAQSVEADAALVAEAEAQATQAAIAAHPDMQALFAAQAAERAALAAAHDAAAEALIARVITAQQ